MSKGEETRHRIVAEAATLFNQRGFEGGSMSELMKATGLVVDSIPRQERPERTDESARTGYNAAVWQAVMQTPQYAVVAYVKDELGRFVEQLRREVDPCYGHLPAHITVLPPRSLQGTESNARDTLEEVCSAQHPFEITLGDVESFIPRTPVVFIRVAHAAYKMRELHDHLNTGPFLSEEPWPYMPHLTIIKGEEPQHAQEVLAKIRRRWAEYQGTRRIPIDQLTFVRQAHGPDWKDLAPVQLGSSLISKAR